MPNAAIQLRPGADLDGFRAALRGLVADDIAPENVTWTIDGAPSLFGCAARVTHAPVPLSREAADLIRLVVCHRDPERYGLLHRLVWRMLKGERALLEIASDPLVFRIATMAKTIRRDLHKMHAFLRFRRADDDAGERYVAWFEPDHFIVEETAGFFVDRFRGLRWSILTPVGSLHWDKDRLTHGGPGRRQDVPQTDAFEAGWATYYASTFNPARVNTAAMQREMPKKYWRNMPETNLIPDLLRNAGSRVQDVMSKVPAAPRKRDPARAVAARLEPDVRSLDALNAMILRSEPFVKGGTRAVLGEGPINPLLCFVGEQPGDQEDLQGRPFVGPAGQLLSHALEEAGVVRAECYVTNAVKHFKYEQRGKRRLHQKPTTGEVRHYRWWLMKELEFVQPVLVVALGATALLALSNKTGSVTASRGPADLEGRAGFVTVHPSYLLRLPDPQAKDAAYQAFVADLSEARLLAERRLAGAA
jgi:uracil-DNA glycosylase